MKLKIQKFNPLLDSKPYYVEGEIEWRDKITALDAVYLFHTTVEPINFNYSCGGRTCGGCATMIDGEPKLLCITVLDDSTHTIEPLSTFPVIRDLVVDKTSFDNCMTNISARVMLEPITKENLAPTDYVFDETEDLMRRYGELCSRCGVCNAACPTLVVRPDEYAGPAQMFQIGFRYLDWYDEADRLAQAVSAGMYHCIMCGTCASVCPMMIEHLTMWQLLRDDAEKRGLVPSYAE
jgi:succinate dehydrogenase/fumarate reductase iron-sulfur protein